MSGKDVLWFLYRKTKWDIQNCIRLSWYQADESYNEIVGDSIKQKLGQETNILKSQLDFMPERSMLEAIYIVRRFRVV